MFKAVDYPIRFAELAPFRREAPDVWTKEEMQDLRQFLALNPHAGDVISGTNGVRKLRWRIKGTGKSRGARVLYYFCDLNMPLYLIAVYRKSEKDSLTQGEKNAMFELVDEIVDAHSEALLRKFKDQLA